VDVRKRFDVSVLMVKHADVDGKTGLTPSPSAGYVFVRGDVLLVIGSNDAIRKLELGVE
jgi:K+/H+ antiporter YhaU regulatory subunit KhtT